MWEYASKKKIIKNKINKKNGRYPVRSFATIFTACLIYTYCGVSFRIMYRYYYYACLANYGASDCEAVNLCSRYGEKSTQYSDKNAPVILENKISCSITVVCASSFRPSQYIVIVSVWSL
jgi:hypothetical protein